VNIFPAMLPHAQEAGISYECQYAPHTFRPTGTHKFDLLKYIEVQSIIKDPRPSIGTKVIMEDHIEEGFRSAFPDLPWLKPGSAIFKERRVTYFADNPAIPLAIACPRNADEVSAIIRLAKTCKTPFTVRSGGHDLHGRSIIQDGICIDMRDINFLEISADRKTAQIGGGIPLAKLVQELSKEGLATPVGAIPEIGYVGWATLGGYSPLSPHWGLGVDQIVEAEVVNAEGEIIDAGKDMLTGIRGAGGNFGVINSLRIKIYELKMVS
jgi:FAD binding domain